MPPLVLVIDHLRLDRELEKQGVQAVHRGLIIAGGCGSEKKVELFADVLEHSKIAPCDRTSQAVAKGARACGRAAKWVQLFGSLDCGVGKPNR